jgi:FG-GAP repeat
MNKKATLSILILLLMFLAPSYRGNATPPFPERIRQVAELTGAETNQAFGYSVAISADTIAVGDIFDNQDGAEAGSVTLYQSDAAGHWIEVTRVTPTDAEAGIHFGRNLALSGDRLVVGAPNDNDYGEKSGSVYIFERNQGGPNAWGQVAKLTSSDAFTNDRFGWAVAVDGDTVVSSAYTKTYGGRVYVFERDVGGPGQWGETTQLNPDPPGFQACFGESVDLEGDLLVVGAYGGGDYSGYAYVFQHQLETGEWLRLTRFRAADTYAYHYFGYAVAIDGWTILAGAPGADGLKGKAYIFTADPAEPAVWTEQAQLTAGDGALGDYFGLELDLSGERAWIGAPVHNNDTGGIYLYDRNQGGADLWGEVTSLAGEDSVVGDEFGYWTSIDGNIAVAGAPGHLPFGAVYVFNLDPPWLTHLPMVMR